MFREPISSVLKSGNRQWRDWTEITARKIEINAYLVGRCTRERVSEVDLMSSNYLLSFLRQIAVAAERALQRALGTGGSLIPIPIRTVVNPRRLDQRRSRD
jgi:hypothetical protein